MTGHTVYVRREVLGPDLEAHGRIEVQDDAQEFTLDRATLLRLLSEAGYEATT